MSASHPSVKERGSIAAHQDIQRNEILGNELWLVTKDPFAKNESDHSFYFCSAVRARSDLAAAKPSSRHAVKAEVPAATNVTYKVRRYHGLNRPLSPGQG